MNDPLNPAPPAPPAPPQAQVLTTSSVPVAPEAGLPVAPEAAGAMAPPPPPAPAPAPAVTQLPAQAAQAPAPEAVLPPEWPYKGYTGAQPWQASNPPAITHNQRMVTSGTNGPEVVELAALLARLGYPTAIASGGNPHAIYDAEMASAVRQFSADYGVGEDPAIIAAMTTDVVGPWLWEALFRAVHKAAA